MDTVRSILLVIASAGLLYVSRASLLRPRSHGFYRFWAWEAIVVLILLAAPVWFREPFAWRQVISWLLLIACLVPLVLGLCELAAAGRASQARSDPALHPFEKTTELVTTGILRHIRHPMYSSLLLLAWGAFFKAPSWLSAGLVAAATGCLVATAVTEERENSDYFGPAYTAYMQRTKRFIPFVF